MAESKPFDAAEWASIRGLLETDPDAYGLPKLQYGSVLLGSFNLRKLGDPDARDEHTWAFLADVCRRFDLLAVQEVMDGLRGITKLKKPRRPLAATNEEPRTARASGRLAVEPLAVGL